jgi:hypothetical protein
VKCFTERFFTTRWSRSVKKQLNLWQNNSAVVYRRWEHKKRQIVGRLTSTNIRAQEEKREGKPGTNEKHSAFRLMTVWRCPSTATGLMVVFYKSE